MVRTHSWETLDSALSQLVTVSNMLESRYEDDREELLKAFVFAGHRIAEHENLPHILMGEFIENYITLYEQNYGARKEFMDEWGYGRDVPRFRTRKDYTNLAIKLEEGAVCSVAAYGVWMLLAPFIGQVAAVFAGVTSVVFATSYLFDTCKEKLAERYNNRLTSTPGYEQQVQFKEGLDQLVKDTLHKDTFGQGLRTSSS